MAAHPAIEVWLRTAQGFDDRVRLVADDQWSARTPCDEWTVRDLVEHAVAIQRGAGRRLGYDVESSATWEEVRDRFGAAVAGDLALDETFSHPMFGVVPRATVLLTSTNDLLVHTWDLARAIGADLALDQAAVAACYDAALALPTEVARAPGVWGPPVAVADDADLQTRLLAYVGRRPGT